MTAIKSNLWRQTTHTHAFSLAWIAANLKHIQIFHKMGIDFYEIFTNKLQLLKVEIALVRYERQWNGPAFYLQVVYRNKNNEYDTCCAHRDCKSHANWCDRKNVEAMCLVPSHEWIKKN